MIVAAQLEPDWHAAIERAYSGGFFQHADAGHGAFDIGQPRRDFIHRDGATVKHNS